MPVLTAYMLAGEVLHEWLGAWILVLFFLHHALNFQWIKNLFSGKYTISRIVKTIVNVLILVMIIGLAHSGNVLSRHVFADLDIRASRANARSIHMFCSYWGFVLMSLHFGFHWDMFLGVTRKFTKKKSVLRSAVLRVLAAYSLRFLIWKNHCFYLLQTIWLSWDFCGSRILCDVHFKNDK